MASPAASSATATNLATRKSLLTNTIDQNSVMSYQRVFAIAVLIMALGAHNCLSNPLPDPSPSAGSGCAEGSTTSKPTALNCPNEAPSTTKAEENAVLAQLHCNVSSLWEKSLNACVELSAFSMSKQKECCPNYKPAKNLSLSDVVLLLAGYTSMGRGVVELGRKVCKEEEAKFIQGHPNEYAECNHILRLAENIVNGGMATILLRYRCGCPNAMLPDGRDCSYKPLDKAEVPQDVSSDVRGLAKWASRLADISMDMRMCTEIRRRVGPTVINTCHGANLPTVDLSFCQN